MKSRNSKLQTNENLCEYLLSTKSEQNMGLQSFQSSINLKCENVQNLKPYANDDKASKSIKMLTVSRSSNKKPQKLLSILKNEHAEDPSQYQLDFTAPKSPHIHFRFQNASSFAINRISELNIAKFLKANLRKSMNRWQIEDIHQKLISPSYRSRSSSQTLTPLTKEETICVLQLWPLLMRIGTENKLDHLLDLLQKLILFCDSQTVGTKKQILFRLIKLTNHSESFFAVRMYQVFAVLAHVFDFEKDMIIFILKVFKSRLDEKQLRCNQEEYIRYLSFILLRKLAKKQSLIVQHCPIKYQLAALIFLRQIKMPFYLPFGGCVMVLVQCYQSFSDIKQRVMQSFGIDACLYKQQLFQFVQLSHNGSSFDQLPLNEDQSCWNQLSYMYYLKQHYSKVKQQKNLFIVLKIMFPFKTNKSDIVGIELLFANYYLQYCLGRIDADRTKTLQLISLANIIKYKHSDEVIYPIKYQELLSVKSINDQIINMKAGMKEIDQLALKYEFVQICNKISCSLSISVPTLHYYKISLSKNDIFFIDKKAGTILKTIDINSIKCWESDEQHIILYYNSHENRGQIIISDHSKAIASFLSNRSILLKEISAI